MVSFQFHFSFISVSSEVEIEQPRQRAETAMNISPCRDTRRCCLRGKTRPGDRWCKPGTELRYTCNECGKDVGEGWLWEVTVEEAEPV